MNGELTDKRANVNAFLFSEEEQAKTRRLYFRDLFREARNSAISNAENFNDLIFALEKLGKCLYGETERPKGLGEFRGKIIELAGNSVLSRSIPKECPEFHTKFSVLYEFVCEARNSAMHEGAFARHLTQHAIEISIILEDALMPQRKKVNDFMVRNPICAFTWQPISFVRQNMLANSFSYLPIYKDDKWQLISDIAITKYLGDSNGDEKRKKLSRKLENAEIEITSTKNIKADFLIQELLADNWDGLPVCVIANDSNEIVGILTPFDLL